MNSIATRHLSCALFAVAIIHLASATLAYAQLVPGNELPAVLKGIKQKSACTADETGGAPVASD